MNAQNMGAVGGYGISNQGALSNTSALFNNGQFYPTAN